MNSLLKSVLYDSCIHCNAIGLWGFKNDTDNTLTFTTIQFDREWMWVWCNYGQHAFVQTLSPAFEHIWCLYNSYKNWGSFLSKCFFIFIFTHVLTDCCCFFSSLFCFLHIRCEPIFSLLEHILLDASWMESPSLHPWDLNLVLSRCISEKYSFAYCHLSNHLKNHWIDNMMIWRGLCRIQSTLISRPNVINNN